MVLFIVIFLVYRNILINKINLKEIGSLEAPSTNSHFDGAASATVTILANDQKYISNNFDHENPPSELKALCDKILSMAEAIENQ